MITVADVIGLWDKSPDLTAARRKAIADLVPQVNALLALAVAAGIPTYKHSATGNPVVGPKYGGFRPQSCPIGAPQSAHKVGMAVDLYDPANALDDWITDEVLTQCGLYREAPRATDTWCHLSTRRPPSGKRTFIP